MKKKAIGILNGPNLGMLGKREPDVYGKRTLADLEKMLTQEASTLGVDIECYQSNSEGALLDKIESWMGKMDGIVFNPGAYSHTSIALRDVIFGSGLKVVEVHISNVYAREEFRHHSYVSAASVGVIAGLGFDGYLMALKHLAKNG